MRKPEWVRKDGFHLVGIERYTSAGPQAIRLAWDEFLDRIGEIRHSAEPQVLYGYEDYTRDFKMIPESFPQFYYLAGLEVEKAEDIPKGMASRYVPPATYALFRHEGPLSEVASVFHYIYQEWLPSSGFEMDPRVMGDFERYPIPVTDRERAVVDIHIPVIPASSEESRRVEIVEQPELRAAVIRSERSGHGTRLAWAKLREILGDHHALEEAGEGLVFIPEWQWATGVRELWTGVKVDSFDGLPGDLDRLELPARLYARIAVKGGRSDMDDAYGHLNDWFTVSGYKRDTAEGVYGFEANRLAPVNPFEIPADSIEWFDYDIYAPIASPGIDALQDPGRREG